MHQSWNPLLGAAVALLVAACASMQGGDHAEETTEREASDVPGNALVVGFEDLQDSQGRLLDALVSHVPGITVSIPSGGREKTCPRISLRGPLVGNQLSNPGVYIDGTRTSDTCSIARMVTHNVERVELYPSGSTSRSGYATHPHGLILVFTRRY